MKIERIDHVGLHVADVARSRGFYADVLGLVEMPRPDLGFPGAWFRVGPQELHLIGNYSRPGEPPRERHFALAVDDLARWAARLREREIEFLGPKERPDGALQIFLRDPDGHVIELLQRLSV